MSELSKISWTGYDDSTTNSSESMARQGQETQAADWHGPLFQNMRRRYGKTIQRRGQTPVGLGPYTDPQMLYWCKLGSQEFRLVVDNGSVKDDITGAIQGGANRFTAGTECNAAWINQQVIIGNGIDPNVSFAIRNGVPNVSRLTVQPCNGANIVLTAGSAASISGTYQYLVVFLNADGVEGTFVGSDSNLSGLSPTITVANHAIKLTNIPLCPAGQDCTGRNIYRNKSLETIAGGTATQFFLVASIKDNTTTTYIDTTVDAALVVEQFNFPVALPNANPPILQSANTPFPPCRYFVSHGGRLLGGYCLTTDSNTNTLHYSDSFDTQLGGITTARLVSYPQETSMGGRVQLVDRAGGDIRALSESYGTTVLVFTGGEAYLWDGTDNANFSLGPFAPHGSVNHHTSARYQNLLIWLAPDGLYTFIGTAQATFTGTSFKRISDDIRNTIDGMSASDLSNASAVISDARYYLFWPNGSLVLDLLYDGSWYKDEPQRFGLSTTSVFTSDNRARIYAIHLADGMVWQLEVGNTDNGQPIPCRLKSPDLPLAGTQKNAQVDYFGALFRSSSDTASGTLYRGTSCPVSTAVVSLLQGSLSQQGLSFIPFDTTAFPVDTVRMRQKAPAQSFSDTFALEIGCDATTGSFEVLEGSMEWTDRGPYN